MTLNSDPGKTGCTNTKKWVLWSYEAQSGICNTYSNQIPTPGQARVSVLFQKEKNRLSINVTVCTHIRSSKESDRNTDKHIIKVSGLEFWSMLSFTFSLPIPVSAPPFLPHLLPSCSTSHSRRQECTEACYFLRRSAYRRAFSQTHALQIQLCQGWSRVLAGRKKKNLCDKVSMSCNVWLAAVKKTQSHHCMQVCKTCFYWLALCFPGYWKLLCDLSHPHFQDWACDLQYVGGCVQQDNRVCAERRRKTSGQ